MDLRLLEYFVAVVDHGGLTRAAERLYLSQPSLSQAIRNLERRLGIELFNRSARGLTLTEQGAAFVGMARQIREDVDGARSKVHAVRDRLAGRLDLAALSTLSVDPLPDLVSRLRRRYPGIVLNVVDPGGMPGLVNDLRRGRVELGLSELPLEPNTMCNRLLGTQEITIVIPPALAAKLPDPVPVSAVKEIPLILEAAGTATRRATLDGVLDVAAENIAVEAAQPQAIWELVRAGAGAALLPRGLAENELSGVVVRSLVPRLRRSIGLVFPPGPLSPAAQAFLELSGVAARDTATGRA